MQMNSSMASIRVIYVHIEREKIDFKTHFLIDCTEFDNAIRLPDTFVFKTLAIETNLYGFLVEFQDFISQKVIKNVIEPPSTRQTLLEDENITSQLYGCFCVNFLINSAQKHLYIKQHTLLSQK